MQTQSNLLEKLSSYNMGRFSQLVSTIIVKSWPIKNGQPEDDFDEVLHHVLTWPDIKHIFSFNGMSVVFIGVYEKLFTALLFPLCRAVNKYKNCPALVLFPTSKLKVFSLVLERKGYGRGS